MNNMTQGSPLKHILKFAFPVWLGILFQQFYSVADTVIVGRFLGLNQLAGVGATSIFSNLVIWFFGGLCNGFCTPGIIQGMGYPMVSLVTGMTEVLGRMFACWVLAGPFGFTGVCFANTLAWVFTAAFALPAYLICKKKLEKKFALETAQA